MQVSSYIHEPTIACIVLVVMRVGYRKYLYARIPTNIQHILHHPPTKNFAAKLFTKDKQKKGLHG